MKLRPAKAKASLVFSIALLVFLIIVTVRDYPTVVGETVTYGSEDTSSWVRMSDGRVSTQEFVAVYEDVREIGLCIDNCSGQEGSLLIEIADSEGQVMFAQSFSVEGQGENYQILIDTSDLDFDKGELYTFTIIADGTTSVSTEAPLLRLYRVSAEWMNYFPGFYTDIAEREGQAALNVTFYHDRVLPVVLLGAASVALMLCGLFDVDYSGLEEKKRARLEKVLKVVQWVFAGAIPFFTFIVFESCTGYLATMDRSFWIYNILLMYAVYIFFIGATGRVRFSSMLLEVLFAIFGIVHYFIESFRGEPLMPYDFAATNTAFSVAGTYRAAFTYDIVVALILFWVLFMFTSKLRIPAVHGKKHLIAAIVGVTVSVCFIGFMIRTDYLEEKGITVRYWRLTESYQSHGYLLNTCISIGDMIISAPDGYSTDAILLQASGYDTSADDSVIHPVNIIVIMNESYSDLRFLNPDMDVSTDVWTVLDELYADDGVFTTVCHVPIYGSGTSTSEYECLVGNNMAFLPAGTSPYYLYSGENEYGLASILSAQGYRTVAMHPNLAANWNRDVVYQYMGFDEFYSIDDYSGYDTLRDYVSDLGDYQRLIDLYEAKDEGEPLFIFNVTMQNHGGYNYSGYNFRNTAIYNSEGGFFQKANQYLSLLQSSDEALRYLLDYFEEVSEPTMIMFFGDHQASLGTDFYNDLYGQAVDTLSTEEYESRYITPAFIWTNYDCDFDVLPDVSVNYLGPLMLHYAGLETSAYDEYLLEQIQSLPVVGRMGVIDSEGNFTSWEELYDDPELADIINRYAAWQYNYIFGGRNRLDQVFDVRSDLSP